MTGMKTAKPRLNLSRETVRSLGMISIADNPAREEGNTRVNCDTDGCAQSQTCLNCPTPAPLNDPPQH